MNGGKSIELFRDFLQNLPVRIPQNCQDLPTSSNVQTLRRSGFTILRHFLKIIIKIYHHRPTIKPKSSNMKYLVMNNVKSSESYKRDYNVTILFTLSIDATSFDGTGRPCYNFTF